MSHPDEEVQELHETLEGPPDENYLTWLAEQQIAKQSEGELAWQQDLRRAFTGEPTIEFDFRGVLPRGQGEGEEGWPGREAKANGHAKRKSAGKSNGKHKPVDTSKAIRAEDLLRLEFPPLRWVVPDLIPEGTTILAAEPKIGKSSLVYQVCVEIACDGALLGRKVACGNVLYLALEDSPRRGKTKIMAALDGRGLPTDRLEIWWNAPVIGDGLEEKLREWIDARPNPVLIAIDTLERVRPDADARKESAYRVDVRQLAALQSAFRDTDVALVVVHHSRKEKGDDFVQAVSGTYGLTGTADTIVSIARKRNDEYAVIRATGREVGEIELPAKMVGGLWDLAPEALAATSPERLEAYEIIAKRGPIYPRQVAQIMGKHSEAGRVVVQKMMTRMVADGILVKGKGGYSVTPRVASQSSHEPAH